MTRHLLPRLALLAFCATSVPLLAQIVAPAGYDRIIASANAIGTAVLPGHVPAWANAAHDAGPLPPGRRIEHAVLLLARTPEREAAFQQLLADQQNPASPRFRHWLTPTQTGALYGLSQHDLDALAQWLKAQGLEVEEPTASRIFLSFSGDATSVARAFTTDFHLFTNPSEPGSKAYSITREPSVPAAYAPVIAGVVGLSEQIHHPFIHSKTAFVSEVFPQRDTVTPNVTLTSGSTVFHWILPADFATLYDFNPAYNAGTTGSGQHVAIIGGSRISSADVSNFETLAGLAVVQPNTILPSGTVDPGTTGDGKGGTGDQTQSEATLDVTRVLGTATGAPVDLLLVNQLTDSAIIAAVNYNVSTLNDAVLSMSFGRCEVAGQNSYANAFEAAFSAGAAQGISFFASSGDSEVAACAASGSTYVAGLAAGTNILCTPSVTCVGGTQFSDLANPSLYWSASNNSTNRGSALSYIPEGAWNEPTQTGSTGTISYGLNGTGGAPSIFWPKPTWQTGIGVPADSARDTPDISLSSSGHNSYLTCLGFSGASCIANTSGQVAIAGLYGTSAAAPGMAGIAALLDQKLNTRAGNLNPLLYKLAALYPAAFHDATPATSGVSGCTVTTASTCNNSTPGASGLTGGLAGYPLTVGFDLATGLGSLDVANFLTAAASVVALAPSTSTETSTAASVGVGQSLTFTDAVSGTASAGTVPTGSVQFSVAGVGSGSPVTLAAGRVTLAISFPATGTYAVTALYSGDTNFAPSTASLSITVNGLPTTSALTASPASITAGASNAFADTVVPTTGTGSPTGTVQFSYASTVNNVAHPGPSVVLAGGAASASIPFPSAGTYVVTAVYSGDSTFSPSTAMVTVTVVAAPNPPAFTLAAAPATLTLTAGSSAANTSTITYTSTNGFAGTITPTCNVAYNQTGVTANLPPTCALSSASVTLAAGGTATNIITISSTAPRIAKGTAFAANRPANLSRGTVRGFGSVALAALLLFWLPSSLRRRLHSWQGLSLSWLLGVCLLGMTGCSGSGGGGTPTPTPVPGTTAGVYTVTITGAGTSGTTSLTATTTVALTIQ